MNTLCPDTISVSITFYEHPLFNVLLGYNFGINHIFKKIT
jgi:hypothetical protein